MTVYGMIIDVTNTGLYMGRQYVTNSGHWEDINDTNTGLSMVR